MTKVAKKASLGRGLSSLLGPDLLVEQAQPVMPDSVKTVPISSMVAGRYQSRKLFKEDELKELSESIREVGILQPILVRKADKGYEIIAGERRWRAAQLAGLGEVPVLVKELSEELTCEATLIENIQRDDLTAVEEAKGYQIFLDHFKYTQDQLSQKVGKSRSHVANTLRLLKLPESVLEMIQSGQLTAGHARALLKADDPEALAQEIVNRKMNVRQIEKHLKSLKKKTDEGEPTYQPKDEDLRHLEEQLTQALSAKTEIFMEGAQGNIRVRFTSLQHLDDLIGLLTR